MLLSRWSKDQSSIIYPTVKHTKISLPHTYLGHKPGLPLAYKRHQLKLRKSRVCLKIHGFFNYISNPTFACASNSDNQGWLWRKNNKQTNKRKKKKKKKKKKGRKKEEKLKKTTQLTAVVSSGLFLDGWGNKRSFCARHQTCTEYTIYNASSYVKL